MTAVLHRRRSTAWLIFAMIAALAAPLAVPGGSASAQVSGHSDWVPFVGEVPMGCTAATGASST